MLETNYILKFTTGGQIEITEKEYQTIFNADDNATIGIKRIGIMIQKRMVQIFPKKLLNEIENRKNQQIGILHDGTNVKKHFGVWVVNGNEMPDDKGNCSPVKLDLDYYPEIKLDRVATPKEYLKIKKENLNYYETLEITSDIIKRLNNKKFTGIKDLLK